MRPEDLPMWLPLREGCEWDSIFTMHQCFDPAYDYFPLALLRLAFWIFATTPRILWWTLMFYHFRRLVNISRAVVILQAATALTLYLIPWIWQGDYDRLRPKTEPFFGDCWQIWFLLSSPNMIFSLYHLPENIKDAWVFARDYAYEDLDLEILFPEPGEVTLDADPRDTAGEAFMKKLLVEDREKRRRKEMEELARAEREAARQRREAELGEMEAARQQQLEERRRQQARREEESRRAQEERRGKPDPDTGYARLRTIFLQTARRHLPPVPEPQPELELARVKVRGREPVTKKVIAFYNRGTQTEPGDFPAGRMSPPRRYESHGVQADLKQNEKKDEESKAEEKVVAPEKTSAPERDPHSTKPTRTLERDPTSQKTRAPEKDTRSAMATGTPERDPISDQKTQTPGRDPISVRRTWTALRDPQTPTPTPKLKKTVSFSDLPPEVVPEYRETRTHTSQTKTSLPPKPILPKLAVRPAWADVKPWFSRLEPRKRSTTLTPSSAPARPSFFNQAAGPSSQRAPSAQSPRDLLTNSGGMALRDRPSLNPRGSERARGRNRSHPHGFGRAPSGTTSRASVKEGISDSSKRQEPLESQKEEQGAAASQGNAPDTNVSTFSVPDYSDSSEPRSSPIAAPQENTPDANALTVKKPEDFASVEEFLNSSIPASANGASQVDPFSQAVDPVAAQPTTASQDLSSLVYNDNNTSFGDLLGPDIVDMGPQDNSLADETHSSSGLMELDLVPAPQEATHGQEQLKTEMDIVELPASPQTPLLPADMDWKGENATVVAKSSDIVMGEAEDQKTPPKQKNKSPTEPPRTPSPKKTSPPATPRAPSKQMDMKSPPALQRTPSRQKRTLPKPPGTPTTKKIDDDAADILADFSQISEEVDKEARPLHGSLDREEAETPSSLLASFMTPVAPTSQTSFPQAPFLPYPDGPTMMPTSSFHMPQGSAPTSNPPTSIPGAQTPPQPNYPQASSLPYPVGPSMMPTASFDMPTTSFQMPQDPAPTSQTQNPPTSVPGTGARSRSPFGQLPPLKTRLSQLGLETTSQDPSPQNPDHTEEEASLSQYPPITSDNAAQEFHSLFFPSQQPVDDGQTTNTRFSHFPLFHAPLASNMMDVTPSNTQPEDPAASQEEADELEKALTAAFEGSSDVETVIHNPQSPQRQSTHHTLLSTSDDQPPLDDPALYATTAPQTSAAQDASDQDDSQEASQEALSKRHILKPRSRRSKDTGSGSVVSSSQSQQTNTAVQKSAAQGATAHTQPAHVAAIQMGGLTLPGGNSFTNSPAPTPTPTTQQDTPKAKPVDRERETMKRVRNWIPKVPLEEDDGFILDDDTRITESPGMITPAPRTPALRQSTSTGPPKDLSGEELQRAIRRQQAKKGKKPQLFHSKKSAASSRAVTSSSASSVKEGSVSDGSRTPTNTRPGGESSKAVAKKVTVVPSSSVPQRLRDQEREHESS